MKKSKTEKRNCENCGYTNFSQCDRCVDMEPPRYKLWEPIEKPKPVKETAIYVFYCPMKNAYYPKACTYIDCEWGKEHGKVKECNSKFRLARED